ncbi:MAG: dipeptidase [Chitinophagales bacterium]|jgi:acetylornithine deacetylase/succinyl-diaminopimelate desuccinylase-like protein|nr:dipeptidase [Chitinophagales bacterium]
MSSFSTKIKENFQDYLTELSDLLAIPSVSADPQFSKSVHQCAHTVADLLRKSSLNHVELLETPGYPVVYGEKYVDESYPTILVYGHYDVQPADPIELWHQDPFNPVIKEGKIYARGAADDKGQFFLHIKALALVIQANKLKYNIKVIIEGEEEVGSKNLEAFALQYKEKLKADFILISDTSMIANEHPSITTGLRGLCYMEVEVIGPNRDLHSGVYGGAVANPINELCKMIAKLQDEEGKILIPGFYDQVAEVSESERARMAQAPFSIEDYKNHLDIEEVFGEKDYSVLERVSIRPTIDVNGIWGGYIGEGAKTVLPSKANAKISMRLVPNQNFLDIEKIFEDYFKSIAPKSVKVKVNAHHGGHPAVTSITSESYQIAEKAVEKSYGKKPIPLRTGGSIPIVSMFKSVLGIDTVLLGFGLDSDAIHSPNEHFGLFNIEKGIETLCYLYAKED